MKILAILRLLVDVYGALFLTLMLGSMAVFGVLPYEGLNRLGVIPFYALNVLALAVWAWLAGRMSSGAPASPPVLAPPDRYSMQEESHSDKQPTSGSGQ